MMLVPARVAVSSIQGVGLFAAEDVAAGVEVWRFAEGLDLLLPIESVDRLPDAFRSFLDRYAYVPPAFPGRILLSCDHAKFMNHSETPNTAGRDLSSFAIRAIAAGEEFTCDYRAVCSGWSGFGP